MPTDMSKYPANWQEIRNRILRRAGGNEDDPRVGARCEWCGVRNYTVTNGFIYDLYSNYRDARRVADINPAERKVIVLTIAHIHDMNPQNVTDDNLAALCQKCHNAHDVEHRKQNRAKTRQSKIVQSGQGVLI